MKIGNKEIGKDQPCFIIAEAGVNHNGDVNLALKLIKEAAKTGADCVKFQTFKADRVVTKSSPKASYQLKVTDQAESQLDMLKKLELSYEHYIQIVDHAKKCGIKILSTPYSEPDADFLEELGFDAFKVASGQLIEISFLRYLAKKNCPIILSTGMGTMSEIARAVEVIRESGNEQVIVLQCTTNYPSLMEEANVKAMITMKEAFKVVVGYSDHVPENHATLSAVALGASVVEKHFTLDKNMPGPDHSSSLDVVEFTALVSDIRKVEAALGSGVKEPTEVEKENARGMRRSIVASAELKKGTVLTFDNLCFKRPADGLNPALIDHFVGKKLIQDLTQNQQLEFGHIDW